MEITKVVKPFIRSTFDNIVYIEKTAFKVVNIFIYLW